MKYIKLILFISIACVFVFSLYAIFLERKTHNIFDSIGGILTLIASAIAVITGIITLIILLKSPKNYFFIFLVISSIPLLLILFGKISAYKDRVKINKYIAWRYQLEKQEVAIWKNINNAKKVEEMLSQTKAINQDNLNEYKIFKATVYLGLSDYNKNYFTTYTQFTKENKLQKCDVIERLLKFKKLKTEEDYLFIFKALNKPYKNLDYCIPYNQDSIKREDFYFKTLYAKGYKSAALQALNKKTTVPNYFIRQFKTIKDLEYRKNAFSTLIKNTDFSDFELKEFYKLVLAQKEEPEFKTYLSLFTNKIETLNFNKTEFVNQDEHPFFIELFQLLDKENLFIKAFPTTYVNKQLAYYNEIKGKPFIQFTQFYEQAFNLEHYHAYDGFYFYIKHNNQLIYKGITNKYGCISYKSYDLKSTDIIELSVANLKFKIPIGWRQLLPNWNTEAGMIERYYALGYNPKYENVYQTYGNSEETFNLEMAKKVKTDFDNYFDEKWQE